MGKADEKCNLFALPGLALKENAAFKHECGIFLFRTIRYDLFAGHRFPVSERITEG